MKRRLSNLKRIYIAFYDGRLLDGTCRDRERIFNHWCPEKSTKKIVYAWIHGGLEYQNYVPGLESLQPNPVKKIKTFFVKKSELFDPDISFVGFCGFNPKATKT